MSDKVKRSVLVLFVLLLVVGSFLLIRNKLLLEQEAEHLIYIPLIENSQEYPILGVQTEGSYSIQNLIVPNRIYHTTIRWTEAEATKGTYVYPAPLTQLIDWFAPNPVIIGVKTVPTWARLWEGYQGSPPKPENYIDYANFVVDICTRYKPWGVELFNEPDMGTQGGTQQDPRGKDNATQYYYGAWVDGTDFYGGGFLYGQMTKVVYPIIKKACPDVQILSGALAGADNGLEFLRGAIDGGLTTDYLSFHYYIFSKEEFPATFEYAKRVAELGDWKLVITETSYLQDIKDDNLDKLKSEYVEYLKAAIPESNVEFVLWFHICATWRNCWLAFNCVPGEAYNSWSTP